MRLQHYIAAALGIQGIGRSGSLRKRISGKVSDRSRKRFPLGLRFAVQANTPCRFRQRKTPTLASRWISKHTNPHWHLFRSRSVLRACTNSTMATIAWNDRCFRARIAIVPDTPYSCRERNTRRSLHHLGRYRKRGMAGSLLSSLPQLGPSRLFAHLNVGGNCSLSIALNDGSI